MSNITPCLWFDGNAEEAANFYASLFPDSHVDAVHRAPSDYPSGKTGGVLMVESTLRDGDGKAPKSRAGRGHGSAFRRWRGLMSSTEVISVDWPPAQARWGIRPR